MTRADVSEGWTPEPEHMAPDVHAWIWRVTDDQITEAVAAALPDRGGFLRCGTCGARQELGDVAAYLSSGWPTCCGLTMTWWTQRQIDAGEAPAS